MVGLGQDGCGGEDDEGGCDGDDGGVGGGWLGQ